MGDVGLLGLAAGWSSWVGRYILLINPVDKTLVWWVVFPGSVKVISRKGHVDFMYELMWKWWVGIKMVIKMVKRCWLSHLELFETDVDINPFCYEKHLKKFVVNF